MKDAKDVLKKCEDILEWAGENEWFSPNTVESIYEQLERGVTLTDNQVKAINNIYEMTQKKNDF